VGVRSLRSSKRQPIEKALGIRFGGEELYVWAFTHRSIAYENISDTPTTTSSHPNPWSYTAHVPLIEAAKGHVGVGIFFEDVPATKHSRVFLLLESFEEFRFEIVYCVTIGRVSGKIMDTTRVVSDVIQLLSRPLSKVPLPVGGAISKGL
jgi:hypothetical protein